MKIQVYFLLVVGLAGCVVVPGSAQEGEVLPSPTLAPPVLPQPQALPAPSLPGGPIIDGPGCHEGKCHPQGVKVLTGQESVKVRVIVPREVVTPVERPTLEIVYRDKKCLVTEYVYEPQEVLKKIPFTTMQPCKVVDPCTGKCHYVSKPVTEMRIQKEVVFRAVPKTREIVKKVPFLKETTEVVPQRNVFLEYQTSVEDRHFAIGLPGCRDPQDRYYMAPSTCPKGH